MLDYKCVLPSPHPPPTKIYNPAKVVPGDFLALLAFESRLSSLGFKNVNIFAGSF